MRTSPRPPNDLPLVLASSLLFLFPHSSHHLFSLFSLLPNLFLLHFAFSFAFVSFLVLPLLQAGSAVSACSRLVPPLPCDKLCPIVVLFYRFRLLWFRCTLWLVGSPVLLTCRRPPCVFLDPAFSSSLHLLFSSPLASSLSLFLKLFVAVLF